MKSLGVAAFVAAYLLLFFAAPSFIFSGLKMQNEEAGVRLSFWKKMFLGIFAGVLSATTAIAVYRPAESSWCRDMCAQGSYCDGQGPMILIFTVPLAAIVGSSVSMLWTWISFRIPVKSPWASAFSYRGHNRVLNIGCAVVIEIAYWASFALIVYRVSRNLL